MSLFKVKNEVNKESENIKELKKLLDELPDLANLMTSRSVENKKTKMKFNGVEITMTGLVKREEIAIALCETPEGVIMPKHYHEVYELFGQISGKCQVEINGEIKTLRQKDFIYIPPNTPHSVTYIEKGEQWVIVYPSLKEFPDGLI